MELIELLQQSHNGNGLRAIGEQFGLDADQTAAAVNELAPVVAAAVRRNMNQSPEGMIGLINALNNGDHDRYLDDDDAVRYDNVAGDGNAILGHLFGNKDVSRAVAMQAANTSGIGGSILKKMLPVIASMVLGSVTRKMLGSDTSPAGPPAGGGILGDILGQVLGGGQQRQQPPGGGGLGDLISDVLGGGGQGRVDGGLGDIIGDVLGGGDERAPQRQPERQPQRRRGGGGFDDLLNDMLGGGSGGNARQRDDGPRFNEDTIGNTRGRLDDFLGKNTRRGNAADDLLNSVEDHLRRL